MPDLTPNDIARRLASDEGVIGPKFTLTLEPKEFEENPRYSRFIMLEIRLISNMLQMFFAAQGLTKVTMCWDGLQMVKRPEK